MAAKKPGRLRAASRTPPEGRSATERAGGGDRQSSWPSIQSADSRPAGRKCCCSCHIEPPGTPRFKEFRDSSLDPMNVHTGSVIDIAS